MIRSTSKHIDKCLEIIQCCIIIFMYATLGYGADRMT